MQWITGVLQVRRIARRGYLLFPELSPVRPKEQAPLEPWDRKVQLDVKVEVVASDGAAEVMQHLGVTLGRKGGPAELAEGEQVEPIIRRLLENPAVAYIHAHNAKRRCYSGRIDRA